MPGKSPGYRLHNMDRLISCIVRMVVWLSALAKPLSRLGLFRYEEWHKGQPLKVLLVGYNGARNTGADARVPEVAPFSMSMLSCSGSCWRFRRIGGKPGDFCSSISFILCCSQEKTVQSITLTLISMSSMGRSPRPVAVPCIISTTSRPCSTSPNTVYWPSRWGVPPTVE